MIAKRAILCGVVCVLVAGCVGGRFISADTDLEEIYIGKTYYEVTDDFGRPDATLQDGREGTKIAYNFVSLNGTKAEVLYGKHTMRNRVTKSMGVPSGGITFSFDANMRCYAVDSDFQRERAKGVKPAKVSFKEDVRKPIKIPPRIPRTLEYPYLKDKSPFAEDVSVEKVEVDKEYVKVFFVYRSRTPKRQTIVDNGLFVMPETYVEDCATGMRYDMTAQSGITLYPERTRFAQNQGGYDVLHYTLTFRPVADDTEFINIIEPGHSGYNFYQIDIRTPMTSKEELKR